MRRTLSLLFLFTIPSVAQSHPLPAYKGTPYMEASRHVPQTIPGKIECAFFDQGGEGIAYHDADPINHGSGQLNPANGTYLNEFRMREGVDISYAKFHNTPDAIDDNPWTVVMPAANQLYVGWTEPGEWFNITVDVHHAGLYTADLLFTSNRGGTISVDLNGQPASGPLAIPSTSNPADPIPWRQWHHWNLAPNLLKLNLPAGKNVLTIHILTQGQMNLAYFDFKSIR